VTGAHRARWLRRAREAALTGWDRLLLHAESAAISLSSRETGSDLIRKVQDVLFSWATRRDRAAMREQRAALRSQYGDLYDRAAEIMFRHDPMAITFPTIRRGLIREPDVPQEEFDRLKQQIENWADNTDEYEPEVETILPRLHTASSVADVKQIIQEDFLRWHEESCPEPACTAIAEELWAVWTSSSFFSQRTSGSPPR
jgi:hypothetical protein